MARPIVQVLLKGQSLKAILDTGSRRSYILRSAAESLAAVQVVPFSASLGGRSYQVTEGRVIEATVKDSLGQGYKFAAIMHPIDDLGSENGARIDVLIGALLLEDWGAMIDESKIPPLVEYRLLQSGTLIEL